MRRTHKVFEFCLEPGSKAKHWKPYAYLLDPVTQIRYVESTPMASSSPNPNLLSNKNLYRNEWVSGLFEHLYERDKEAGRPREPRGDQEPNGLPDEPFLRIFPNPDQPWQLAANASPCLGHLVNFCRSKVKGRACGVRYFKPSLLCCSLWFKVVRRYLSMRHHGQTSEKCTDSSCSVPYLSFAMLRRELWDLKPSADWTNTFLEGFLSDITTYDVSRPPEYCSVLQTVWMCSVYYLLKILYHSPLAYARLLRAEVLFVLKRLFDVLDLVRPELYIDTVYRQEVDDIRRVSSKPSSDLWAYFMTGKGDPGRALCDVNAHSLTFDFVHLREHSLAALGDIYTETHKDDAYVSKRDPLFAAQVKTVLNLECSESSSSDEDGMRNVFRKVALKRQRLNSDVPAAKRPTVIATDDDNEDEKEDGVFDSEAETELEKPAKANARYFIDNSAEEEEDNDRDDVDAGSQQDSFINDVESMSEYDSEHSESLL